MAGFCILNPLRFACRCGATKGETLVPIQNIPRFTVILSSIHVFKILVLLAQLPSLWLLHEGTFESDRRNSGNFNPSLPP